WLLDMSYLLLAIQIQLFFDSIQPLPPYRRLNYLLANLQRPPKLRRKPYAQTYSMAQRECLATLPAGTRKYFAVLAENRAGQVRSFFPVAMTLENYHAHRRRHRAPLSIVRELIIQLHSLVFFNTS